MKNHRRRVAIALLALVMAFSLMLVGGCATTQVMKDWNPKQKAIYANGLYVKQWDAYVNKIAIAANVDPLAYMEMVMSEDPGIKAEAARIAKEANLTEEQRKVLRVQKKALISMEAALDLYELAIAEGRFPSPALEARMLSLSNQLESWLLAQDW